MKAIGTLLYSLVSAVLAAIAIQYFVGDWKEEYLNYSLSESKQVVKGIWQRNIELRNNGVDPALNVKVYVYPLQSDQAPRVESEFDVKGNGGPFVGGFERIRRKEVLLLSVRSNGAPITESQLAIKSDRSIAEFRERAPWPFWSWSWLAGLGTFLVVYIFLAIAIPARRDYLKAARLAKEAAEGKRKQRGP